jgi:uncharacterized OB-fold protein
VKVPARPGPVARNEATAWFFDAAADGTFTLKRCPAGHWNRPQGLACSECGRTGLTPAPASGRARLVSWAVVHARPMDGTEPGPPAVPAIVELEEGPWWWTSLVDVDPDQLAEGQPLRLVWEHPPGSEAVPAFTADSDAA